MSIDGESFYTAPTLRQETVKENLERENASILGRLSQYTSHLKERIKKDTRSSLPLLVRLTEMDIVEGIEIIGDDRNLFFEVLSNDRVMLKNYAVVKAFVDQSKQIAATRKISRFDPRLKKIQQIESKIENIGKAGYKIPSFYEEFPNLSEPDRKMLDKLDKVYIELLRKRSIKALPAKELTLKDETHQFLSMFLDNKRGVSVPVDPIYVLRNLHVAWEEKLMGDFAHWYPHKNIQIQNRSLLISDSKLMKTLRDDFTAEQCLRNVLNHVDDISKDRASIDVLKAAYEVGDASWFQLFKNAIAVTHDEGTAFDLIGELTELMINNNDENAIHKILPLVGVHQEFIYRELAIAQYARGDSRYQQWLDKLSSSSLVINRDQALHEIAIHAYSHNRPEYEKMLKLITDPMIKNTTFAEIAVLAYEKRVDFKTFLKQISDPVHGAVKDSALSQIALLAYKKGDPAYRIILGQISGLITGYSTKYFAWRAVIIAAFQKNDMVYQELLDEVEDEDDREQIKMDCLSECAIGQYTHRGIIDRNILNNIRDGLVKNVTRAKIALYAYHNGDKRYKTLLDEIPQEDIEDFSEVEDRVEEVILTAYKQGDEEPLNIFKKKTPLSEFLLTDLEVENYKRAYTLRQDYRLWQLTRDLHEKDINAYLATLPPAPSATGTPLQARMINQVIQEQPELFIEQYTGVSQRSSEFSSKLLVNKLFSDIIYQTNKTISQKNKSWAQHGYDISDLGKALPSHSPDKYLLAREYQSLEGGDPQDEGREVLRTNLPLGNFLVARRLVNLDIYGKSSTKEIVFDEYASTDNEKGTRYTITYSIPVKQGQVTLAFSPNSLINEFEVDGVEKAIPLTNQYEVISDETKFSYAAIKSPSPQIPLVAYAQETTPEALKNAKLPYELEAFIDEIRTYSFVDQLAKIQELRNRYFFYDKGNKRVATLKFGKSLQESITVMRLRAEELKQESPNDTQLAQVRWAGVCSDITFITAALLTKLEIPFYVDIGFSVGDDGVVTTREGHSQLCIPMRDEEGRQYDLEFDPTNSIVRLGHVKLTSDQLHELVPIDKPAHPFNKVIQPIKTFSFTPLHQRTPVSHESQKEKELYTKIAAIAETIAGSSVMRPNEVWTSSVLDRLDSIQHWMLSKIWNEVLSEGMSKKQARQLIFDHALGYVQKRKGTINKETFKKLISSHQELSFLIQ